MSTTRRKIENEVDFDLSGHSIWIVNCYEDEWDEEPTHSIPYRYHSDAAKAGRLWLTGHSLEEIEHFTADQQYLID